MDTKKKNLKKLKEPYKIFILIKKIKYKIITFIKLFSLKVRFSYFFLYLYIKI